MDGLYTMASSSVSSLYGNVNCAIRELILSKFPRDFFKYEAVSTEFAPRNMRRQFGGNNSTKEFVKREKPQLLIQPMYQEPDRDAFLQEIPLTKNIDDLQFRVDGRYLMTVTRDEEYGYCLKYKLNRDRIEFEVRLVFDTLHQQLDTYKALHNQIVWERPYARNTALESIIPKSIIHHIGYICRMDVQQDEYQIPILLQRLNATSAYPITYKLRNASATDEYYMYYMHNMIITFSDLAIEEGQRRNFSDDHYDIRFKVTAEFNLPGMYMITGNIEKLVNYKAYMVAMSARTNPNELVSSDYIPLFTIDNIYSKFPPEKDGMRLLGSSRFTCDKKGERDSLEIDALFTREQRKAIQFYTTFNMQPEVIVKLIVLRNNDVLEPNIDYLMEWNDFRLTILDPDPEKTYRFLVYQNLNLINEIIMDAQDEHSLDKYRLKQNNTHKEDQFPKAKLPDYPVRDSDESLNVDVSEKTDTEDSITTWAGILGNSTVYNSSNNLNFE